MKLGLTESRRIARVLVRGDSVAPAVADVKRNVLTTMAPETGNPVGLVDVAQVTVL